MSEAAGPHGLGSVPGTVRMLSDDRLTRRATRGDQRAFAAIYSRYSERLYRFCLAIVGNSQDAQDALQNTMVKVLKALPGEERQIQLKPWLYRIAHNESVELLRRRRGTEQLDPELAGKGAGLAEEAAARERLRLLISDLEELPDRQRAALVMRELAGLDFTEIGAALETSPVTARQTLYEARLSLHQMDAGREMSCETVMKALSDGDGRVTRRRDIRAHLRTCTDCRRFREELQGRQGDFAALSPLPAAAAAALLQGVLGGSGGGAVGGGLSGTLGGGMAGTLGTSAVVKSAATVAVVAIVGVSATRSDLVDIGLPGGGGSPERQAGPSDAASQNTVPPLPAASPRVRERSKAGGADGRGVSRQAEVKAAGPTAAARGEQSGPETLPPSQSPGSSRGNHRGHGQESNLPAAAAHGQQTAAAHKQGAGRGGNQAAKPHPIHPAKPPQPATPGPKQTNGSPADPRGSGKEIPPQANAVPADPQGAPSPGAANKP